MENENQKLLTKEEKQNAIDGNLINQIEEFKTKYYTENKKNTFFTKTQKNDCAEKICKNFDMTKLLWQTAYIPQNNQIYIDYTAFKLYANSNNYSVILNHVLYLVNKSITEFNGFEFHINLQGLTVTAIERYKDAIFLFCNQLLSSTSNYSNKIENICFYYSPSIVDGCARVFTPLIDIKIREKIQIYSKEDSCNALAKLLCA